MADEFTRIAEILKRLHHDAPYVDVHNGDDAAVLRLDGSVVLSVDTAVEGTHFRREWLTFRELGTRATTAALSDLAAMGANARAMLTSLVAPPDVSEADLYAIAEGCADMATRYGAPVVGGNLSRGRELSLTTTVVGVITQAALRRCSAMPGDAIYVTGTLGAAALGLQCLLQQVTDPLAQDFIARWKQPVARLSEGAQLVPLATAAIDISDGVLQDLAHVCRASSVGAVIHVERLPLAAHAQRLATMLGQSATNLALVGGEDYELLFAARPGTHLPFAATLIGEVTSGAEVVVLDRGAVRDPRGLHGFRHFE